MSVYLNILQLFKSALNYKMGFAVFGKSFSFFWLWFYPIWTCCCSRYHFHADQHWCECAHVLIVAAENTRDMIQAANTHITHPFDSSCHKIHYWGIKTGIQRKIFVKDKKKETERKSSLASSCPLPPPHRRSSNVGTVCISVQCFYLPDRGNFSLLNKWINECGN